MAAMSDYLSNKLVDFVMRGQTFTTPTHVYVALCTLSTLDADTGSTITEPSGANGYARQPLDPAAANWSATQGGAGTPSSGTGGTTVNLSAIVFGPAREAAWGTVTHVAILDAAEGGNLLFHGPLTVSRYLDLGDTLTFDIGDLAIQIDD